MKIRKLSDRKVLLSQNIPIKTSNGHIVAHQKVNMIYTINPDNSYEIIYPKEKFIRQLSVRFGVKKIKITYNYKRNVDIYGKIFSAVLFNIILDDKILERDILIKKILENEPTIN